MYEINTAYYKQVIWVALDFKKAYDSIDRGKLIETMVKYKINPKIIDIAAKLYSEDETVIKLGGKEGRVRVTSGIRQGCTSSTIFFKIITYRIIEEMQRRGEMFEVDGIRLNSIWFADDSVLIANSIEAARANIKIVKRVAKGLGLEVNEAKSKVLIIKGKKEVREQIPEVSQRCDLAGHEVCQN